MSIPRARRSKAADRTDSARSRTPATRVSTPQARSRLVAFALPLLLLAALVLHLDALRMPFFADDFLFLDSVRDRSLLQLFQTPDPLGNYYRPLARQFHFWWLAHLTHESATAMHAVNVLLLLGALAIFFQLVRHLSSRRAATLACAVLAVHYVAEVPVLWVSGCQDLLAVVGGLGALYLFIVRRQRILAGLVLFLGLLCKETIVLTPLVALAYERLHKSSLRTTSLRVLPLFIAVTAWGVLDVAHSRVLPHATSALLPLAFAALVHLPQVALGWEWPTGGPKGFSMSFREALAILLAAGSVVLAWTKRPRSREVAPLPGSPETATLPLSRTAVLWLALVWAVCGAVPITAAASIWSAYYYLFPLCGVLLLLGVALERAPVGRVAIAALLLMLGSQYGRHIQEFAVGEGAWTTVSHVNPFYLQRSMKVVRGYLAQLQSMHPTLPHGSTLYFAGIPPFVGWQAGNGALLRWAYRDSSLRTHYLAEFDGGTPEPVFFFDTEAGGERLVEKTSQPQYGMSLAYGAFLSGKFDVAERLVRREHALDPRDLSATYLLALFTAPSHPSEAIVLLRGIGLGAEPGSSPDLPLARRALAVGDTVTARGIAYHAVTTHALDPNAHALMADVMMSQRTPTEWDPSEAAAVCILAPGNAAGWRRMALIQTAGGRYPAALASLNRYFALAGSSGAADEKARALEAWLKAERPGGTGYVEHLRELVVGKSH